MSSPAEGTLGASGCLGTPRTRGLSGLTDRSPQHLQQLGRLPLDSVKMQPCYQHADLLLERSAELQSRFRFPHVHLVAQRAQSYMQEVLPRAFTERVCACVLGCVSAGVHVCDHLYMCACLRACKRVCVQLY